MTSSTENKLKLTCPICGWACQASEEQCPSCQFDFSTPQEPPKEEKQLKREVHFETFRKVKYTETIRSNPSVATATVGTVIGGTLGSLLGLVSGFIGLALVVMLFPLGLLCGVPLIILAIIFVVSGFAAGVTVDAVDGFCPSCGELNKMETPEYRKRIRCKSCDKAIIYERDRFYQECPL